MSSQVFVFLRLDSCSINVSGDLRFCDIDRSKIEMLFCEVLLIQSRIDSLNFGWLEFIDFFGPVAENFGYYLSSVQILF